jgi:LPXTG-motif cell wall-anchored protein
MKRVVAILALAAGSVLLVQGVTAASPGIGQGPCHHGNSNKSCRPDPQPNHGKDCAVHGKNGGGNQDHCKTSSSPSPTPSVGVSPSATASVQGVTLTRAAGQLAKTGSKSTEVFGGVGLVAFGMGMLLTSRRKRAQEA